MQQKPVFLALAVAVGATAALYSAQANATVFKEECKDDRTRCITRSDGSIVWGDWSLTPVDPPK